MSFGSTPRRSQTICLNAVSWPWPWLFAPQKSVMDPETARSLKALGYLAPTADRAVMAGLDPKSGLPLFRKLDHARHLAQRQRWAEAEQALREVVAAVPGNASAMTSLALTMLRQGDFAGAREQYLRVLAIDPKDSRVYVMLGAISMLEGDLESAERNYRRALAITPGFVEAIANLGMIAALRDDDAEAERWYRRAMAADPNFPLAYRRLADVHYERGDFAGALDLYRKALGERSNDFAAAVQAGNSARQVGRRELAAQYFASAARLNPSSWVPPYNLACLEAANGDPQGALALLATLKGFSRTRLLENDRDLEPVRRLPGYPAVLEQLKAAAKRERRLAAQAAPAPGDEGDPDPDFD